MIWFGFHVRTIVVDNSGYNICIDNGSSMGRDVVECINVRVGEQWDEPKLKGMGSEIKCYKMSEEKNNAVYW